MVLSWRTVNCMSNHLLLVTYTFHKWLWYISFLRKTWGTGVHGALLSSRQLWADCNCSLAWTLTWTARNTGDTYSTRHLIFECHVAVNTNHSKGQSWRGNREASRSALYGPHRRPLVTSTRNASFYFHEPQRKSKKRLFIALHHVWNMFWPRLS